MRRRVPVDPLQASSLAWTRRSGHGPDVNLGGTGLQQHARDFGNGGAGRHHVVDQRDAALLQFGTPGRLDRERSAHIAGTLRGRQRKLVCSVSHAQQQPRIDRALAQAPQVSGQLPGLVVATLTQPRRA